MCRLDGRAATDRSSFKDATDEIQEYRLWVIIIWCVSIGVSPGLSPAGQIKWRRSEPGPKPLPNTRKRLQITESQHRVCVSRPQMPLVTPMIQPAPLPGSGPPYFHIHTGLQTSGTGASSQGGQSPAEPVLHQECWTEPSPSHPGLQRADGASSPQVSLSAMVTPHRRRRRLVCTRDLWD